MPSRHLYFAVLKNANHSRSFKISEELMKDLKKYLEPYNTTVKNYSKPVKCIETGKIFYSAGQAASWLKFVKEIDYCNLEAIKQVCKGKQKTAYGYHFEFADKKAAALLRQL